MKIAITILAAAMAATLAGCASMAETRSGVQDMQAHARAQAEALYAQRRTAVPATGAIITDAPYVDTRTTRRAVHYPASFSRTVTVNEPMGLPMSVLAQRVQAMTGVTVYYQPEIVSGANVPMPAAPEMPSVSADSAMTPDASGMPPLSAILPNMPAVPRMSADPRSTVALNYTGNVIGLLNAIATATGASWEYDEAGRSVSYYRYRTETFDVPAVQGEASSTAKMGGAQQGGGSEGGQPMSQASAEGTYTTNGSIWRDLDATLKQLVSPEGAYVLSQTTGTVTVRDRPERVEQVRRYMRQMVATLSRQVDVELTIYRVTVRDDDVRALNWSGLFQNAANKYGINLSTMGMRPATEGQSSLSVTIPTGGTSQWAGSQIIIDALNQLGRTSVEQSTSIVTSNNQPAPFKVVRRTSYLRELSQGVLQSGAGAVQTGPTLTPGMVETGLNMYVIPNVQSDGKRVKLRIMASISSLERMNQVGTTTAFIQIPDTSSREFQSEAWLNSGETLVMAGFQQKDSSTTNRSPFDNMLWFLGGSSQVSRGREIVVIAIRPVVTQIRSRI